MSKSKIFFLILLSFIGGVGATSFLYPKIISEGWFFWGLISVLILIFTFREKRWVIIGGFLGLAFLVGGYLTEKRLEEALVFPEKEFFSGRAVVDNDPEIKDDRQKIILIPEGKNFKVLFSGFFKDQFHYGDEVDLSCDLARPENFEDSFDYRMYLFKDQIFYLCQKGKLEKTGFQKGNLVYAKILYFKGKVAEKISSQLPFLEAGLLFGLLLGGDEKVSQELQEDFSRTGMTHIVAVSGYNVTIVAEYLMLLGIFFGLWRGQAFYAAILGIFLFVVMTGAPASAVRAGVMGSLVLWAMKNGRLANAQNAILFSAGVMLFFNPLLLRWDVGFQLSFLATLGIVYLYPILEKYFLFSRDAINCVATIGVAYFFLEILLLTLAAQIFVLPIILFNFGSLSVVSPLANLLVLPIIPLTMALGFLMVLFSFIFAPFGTVFAWLAYLPLRYETEIIQFLSSFKYASVGWKLTWLGVLIWYIILAGGVYYFRKNPEKEGG